MPSSRVCRRALLLGAGAAVLSVGRAGAYSYCAPGAGIAARYAELASFTSSVAGDFGRVAGTIEWAVRRTGLEIDDVRAINARLVTLAKPMKVLSDLVGYAANSVCYAENPEGLSPTATLAVSMTVAALAKDIVTYTLGGPAGILLGQVLVPAYVDMMNRMHAWRTDEQPWQDIGCTTDGGERCCREARPVIPRNFWCAVDVNHPDDPSSVAYSMCNEVRVVSCTPRDGLPGEVQAGQIVPPPVTTPPPPVPDPWRGEPYDPWSGMRPAPARPPLAGRLPPQTEDIVLASAAAPLGREVAEDGVAAMVAGVDVRAVGAAVADLRGLGSYSEADLLENALALLLAYHVLVALIRRLLIDPTARDALVLGVGQITDGIGEDVMGTTPVPPPRY